MSADAAARHERLALTTADGLRLRAEWCDAAETDDAASAPPGVAALPGVAAHPPTVVLCHPHPLHGGNMHASIIDSLFRALPVLGAPTLRFNFRGVQGSDGRHDHGIRERYDVMAALDFAEARRPDAPVRLIGWSFGADVALATPHSVLDGWIAIAPPLRVTEPEEMAAASDDRHSHLLVGEHDVYRSPAGARAVTATWTATTVAEIPGADHFFTGTLEALVDEVVALVVAT